MIVILVGDNDKDGRPRCSGVICNPPPCRRRCSPLVVGQPRRSRPPAVRPTAQPYTAGRPTPQRQVNFRNQRQIENPGEQVQTRPGRRRATSSANRLFQPARDAYSLSAFHLISIYCRILTSYRGFTNQKCQLYRKKATVTDDL